MYNLEDNIITGKIDGYTNEYNPISREEFTLVSDDWSITNDYIISKDIETDDGVTVLFDVLTPLAYKDVVGVSVSFTSNGDVQSVGIGDEDLIQYCNKDTTDERAKPDGYTGDTVEECEKDTISKNMWNFEVPNTLTNEKNYTIGDDLYLFNWSQDELKTILFDEGLRVRITYTPIASDDNVSTSDHIQISDLVLNVYFVNELQDEIDIIENRLECINLQQVIDEQANRGYKYIYFDEEGKLPSFNQSGWSDEPLIPNDNNKKVYYTTYTLDEDYNNNEDYSVPELYAEYTEISTDPSTEGVVYYEYIYKVNNDPVPPECPTETPSTATAPTGWSVLRKETSDRFKYGWKCIRRKIENRNWGNYYGTLLNDKCVALSYEDAPQFDWDISPSYQYCYILVKKTGEDTYNPPPILEYLTDETKDGKPVWDKAHLMGTSELPSNEFSFKRPNVSAEYPLLYMFRRDRKQDDWSIWKGEGGVYKKFRVNKDWHYLRYTGILVDNYEWDNSEDKVQYCYQIGDEDTVKGTLIWSVNGCYEADGITPKQSNDFVPNGWNKTIPELTSTFKYLYRLKRVKHLGRWGLWYGDEGGINYG